MRFLYVSQTDGLAVIETHEVEVRVWLADGLWCVSYWRDSIDGRTALPCANRDVSAKIATEWLMS